MIYYYVIFLNPYLSPPLQRYDSLLLALVTRGIDEKFLLDRRRGRGKGRAAVVDRLQDARRRTRLRVSNIKSPSSLITSLVKDVTYSSSLAVSTFVDTKALGSLIASTSNC
jgi:hypothetical protein